MNYNDDELVAPGWVDSDFFKKVLEYKDARKNVKINDYKITPATALGDHFASIMFRAKVSYTTETIGKHFISLIIKTLPVSEGMKKELMEKGNLGTVLFKNEAHMYEKVLDKCEEILKKADYDDLLAAKLLYHSTKPTEVLVFEDLKELGYFLYPGVLPNEDESAIIFSKLGQFHAATFKMGADSTDDVKRTGTVFNISGSESFPTLKMGMTFLVELLETLPGFEVATEKLRNASFIKLHESCKMGINMPGTYSVLNHGDYHIRNMMFKGRDGNDISEVVLVDFQVPHWGSPAYDLLYVSAVIQFDRREKAYRTYFNTFTDVLEKAGFEGTMPSYDQLQQEVKSFACLDLYFLLTICPLFCMDKSEIDAQLDTILQDVNQLRKFYKSKRYTSIVKLIMPYLLKQGVLDSLGNSN